jgi:hypothetical protein
MVPVVLLWGEKSILTKMLLDTGATRTFVLPWMMRRLGAPVVEKEQPVKGAGGSIRAREGTVQISLLKARGFGQPAAPTKECPVLVPVLDDALPFPVLGRKPFFQGYEIVLREREGEIIFRSIH